MIYVVCEPEDFFYDIYMIVSLYFPYEKVIDKKGECDISSGSMLIEVSFKLNDSTVASNCSLFVKDNMTYKSIGHCFENHTVWGSKKKSVKYCIKISVFKLLKDYTKIEIPWGILTGIRPSKIVSELKSKAVVDGDIENILKSKYLIRNDKAKLVMKVSKNSYNLLNCDPKRISVYIDIPFCPSICLYCSFSSNPIMNWSKDMDDYMDALEYEITKCADFINKHFKVDTIYIGGGTPTSLNDCHFKRLLDIVSGSFEMDGISEFTVEAGRPDTITPSKLEAMKAAGVGRISINPQSMNDDTLKRIGRNHTSSEIVEKFRLARKLGFDYINMDMILGLPGENLDNVKYTLGSILKLSPENITVHTMAIKRASRLKEKIVKNEQVQLPPAELVEKMMDYVVETMDRSGYLPYYMYRQKMMMGNLENVGYCKSGFQCAYNIQMIEERETIAGFGAHAVSKAVFLDENRIERIANKKDVKEYMDSIKETTDNKLKAFKTLI